MDNNSALNIFITGGTTGAGREASRQAVARGHQVTVLTQGSDGAAKARKDGALPTYSDVTRAGELKSLFRMAQTDVVLHLATQVANGFPLKGTYEQYERLVAESTHAVVEAAKASDVKFLVYASFAFLYGDTHGETLAEDGAGHLDSMFRAALAAEKVVLESGLNVCVLRAGFNYGPEDESTQTIGEVLRFGRGIYLGDSHSIHNWVHDADLAQAAILAAEQQPTGQIFNVVDDQPVSAASFVGALANGMGFDAPSSSNPPAFALNRSTSEAQRALLAASVRLKNDKAKQVLGWQPRYAGHKAGLDQTLLYWRSAEPIKV